jgi:hypothetical protein
MYAEVPPEAIPRLRSHLQEKKIVFMRKIIIEKAKNFFKPVRSPFMIKLNTKTEVIDHKEQLKDFPMYTFVLTPFTELPKYERSNEYFLGTTNLSINLLLTSYIYSSSNKNPLMFVYRCHWPHRCFDRCSSVYNKHWKCPDKKDYTAHGFEVKEIFPKYL